MMGRVVHKWRHAILNIFWPPFPLRHAFYYWGLATVVTKPSTLSPDKTLTSFMADPLTKKNKIFFLLPSGEAIISTWLVQMRWHLRDEWVQMTMTNHFSLSHTKKQERLKFEPKLRFTGKQKVCLEKIESGSSNMHLKLVIQSNLCTTRPQNNGHCRQLVVV